MSTNSLSFYRGQRQAYLNNKANYSDGIFFATDTHEIYVNGEKYGTGNAIREVKRVEGTSNEIELIYADGVTQKVNVGKTTYTSNIEDTTLKMPSAVGGIKANTTLGSLKGKTYDELLDDLLFPTVNPNISVNPSCSISLKEFNSTVEVGSSAPTQLSNFNLGYNDGEIKLNGVTQYNNAAGAQIGQKLYYNGNEANTELPTTVATAGTITYYYKVQYADGPMPKTNKGADYPSIQVKSGWCGPATCTINGSWPWWASTQNTAELTKQQIFNWNGETAEHRKEIVLQPSGIRAQVIKVPRKLGYMLLWNDVANAYNIDDSGSWTITTEVVEVNGKTRTYQVYTYNGAPRGAAKLQLKV